MDRAIFYDVLRGSDTTVFGGSLSQSQVDGMEGILDAMAEVGDGRHETLAYALATAYHETGGRMLPVREGFTTSNEGAIRAVLKLAQRRGPDCGPARYGKPAGPYNKVYYGRGHVQLTWLENYEKCSEDAGVDLVENPDAMLDPVISARILILGLIDGRWNGRGKGIRHYLPPDAPHDLENARRTVNGTDRWQTVARHYTDFIKAIRAAGGVQGAAAALSSPRPAPRPQPPQPTGHAPAPDPVETWLASCPGDVRAIGEWLSRMPTPAHAPSSEREG